MQGREDLGVAAEIGYPDRFHPSTGPFGIALAAALHGVHTPLPASGELSCCDLGCGAGLGCLILAAANPEGRFVGIDLLPHHIDRANRRAREAGIGNARFYRADVRDHRNLPLPDFDTVTVHGVYAWVGPEIRNAIVEFLGSRLRPGGLALVSYNALPGWGGLLTIREWIRSRVEAIGGAPAEGVRQAVEELTSLLERGSPLLSENRGAARLLARFRAADPHYLVHELLTPHGGPLDFREVASDMARGGLHYIGSADPAESCPRSALPRGCRDSIDNVADPLERETLRDIVVNRFFRFDLSRRPGPEPTGDPLDGILFGLDRPAAEVPNVIPAVDREITLDGNWFEPLKRILATAAVTREKLLIAPSLRDYPAEELVDGLRLLHAGGYVRAFRACGDPPPKSPPRHVRVVPELNRIQLERLGEEGAGATLASPVSGTGHWLDMKEALALSALAREEPEAWLAREIERRGITIGAASEGAAPRDLLEGFRTGLLPTYLRLGLAEAVR
jgi:SAM-dependent methyltransferase